LIVINANGPYRDILSRQVKLIDLQKPRVLAALPALMFYVRRYQPQVLISAMSHTNVIALLACRLACARTAVIITEHSTLSVAHKDEYKRHSTRAKLLFIFMKITYDWADKIIAVSLGVADDLAEQLKLNRNDIVIANNPIITKELLQLTSEPIQWPWQHEDGVPFILAVGRLTRAKDFMTLLVAFSLLRSQKRIKLVILGEGELRGELERHIIEQGLEADVFLPGFVANPYAWMAKTDLFVLSSAWEGSPTVLVEAMACGAKVVSTNCPSGPSEILENGRWGALVPVGNSLALFEAMRRSLSNQRAPYEEVKLRVQDFTVEKSIKTYINIIEGADFSR
jgi:glycosyltransferase involved in cell wall biosynthesis